MSTFKVFLPPRSLAPLPLRTSGGRCEPLSFIQLNQPFEDRSASLSLRQRYHAPRSVAAVVVETQEEDPDESIKEMGRKRKRGSVGSSRLALGSGQDSGSRRESVESGISQESDRRRSKRLARTLGESQCLEMGDKELMLAAESLMPTLPALAASASIMSLNTTTSNPSQMVGNDTTLRLPTWHIPLSRLTTLPALLAMPRAPRPRGYQVEKYAASLIVCVMSVESPVCRKRADERAKGLPGTLWIGGWRVTSPPLGEGDPPSCGVKLWDTMAQEWGDDVVRKGDVVLLENVEWKETTAKDPSHISISSSTGAASPKITILYRTLPRYLSNPHVPTTGRSRGFLHDGKNDRPKLVPQDQAFRPDLRLGRSDPGVRRVTEVARWFAEWVEGEPPEQ